MCVFSADFLVSTGGVTAWQVKLKRSLLHIKRRKCCQSVSESFVLEILLSLFAEKKSESKSIKETLKNEKLEQ